MRGARKVRRVVIGTAAAALLCTGMSTGIAHAASGRPVGLELDYTCAVASGPQLTVAVDVTFVLPREGMVGGDVPHFEPAFIDVDLALGGDRAGLAARGGVRLDGDSTATLAASFAGPVTLESEAVLAFAPTWVTASGGGLPLTAAGGFPGLSVQQAGDYAIHLGDLELSLRPERADGTPLGTITATCAPDPAQSTLLGTLKSEPSIVEHPVRPSQLQVTAVTPTSASLSWYAVPWWFETVGYEVHLDGVKVAFVTEKQATITGLAPDSQHRVKIVTRDLYNLSSPPSQGLVFATPPVRG
ncbi:fibronectin type III domain-containing protein [Saccharothrix sp. 6-C]|uniref:fibronectin type III domain-containing protein n=1 Tax=Saccharothrix sp. 6-C TaxID=2781735 RepID=UPI0019178781|nr:fibronectin type III domain-containing protein [Saccharothrix sp. 6-C]QQQ79147.1 fibronectin type III domain-containing protein [Saccharothrix sp. 6-C]